MKKAEDALMCLKVSAAFLEDPFHIRLRHNDKLSLIALR